MVWAKLLEGGDIAIGAFNMGDSETAPYCSLSIPLASLGLNRSCGKSLMLRDLWAREDVGLVDDVYLASLPAHGCRMFRARLVNR